MIHFLAAALLTVAPQEEILHLLPDYAQPKYSSNEQMLAYLAPDKRGAYNLYVDGECLTQERRSISQFRWEPDNAHILYLYDENGDENFHLYRVDLTGRTEDLTPFENVHVELIALDKSLASQALITMNLRDPRYNDYYRIDLETKKLTPVLPQNDHRVQGLSEQKLEVQAIFNLEADGRKFLEICTNGTWQTLCELDPDDWYAEIVKMSPDKSKIILLSSMDLPTRGIYAIDLQSGHKELLFSHPTLDCLKGYFHPETGALQAALVRDGFLEWHFFDTDFQQNYEMIAAELKEGEIQLISRLSKDQKWFILHRQDDAPNAYYLWNKDAKKLTLAYQESPNLLNYTFGKMESFHFNATDGQQIQGYFLRPPVGEAPYPTVVQVHGGPHARDQWGFFPHRQYLSSQGYAVLFINYRGSLGFGKKFMMADKGEWGNRVFEDIIDGKRWAVEQGWVDPTRVALRGGSYGGYMALLGLTLTPDEFQCCLADCPIVDPFTWMPQGYVVWGFTYERLYRDAVLCAKSPLTYASHVNKPLLMTHADNDLRVVQEQSQKMSELLQLYRIPHTYIVHPKDGHNFLDPDNRRHLAHEVDAFLQKFMPIR